MSTVFGTTQGPVAGRGAGRRSGRRRSSAGALVCLLALAVTGTATADTLVYDISGVSNALLENVQSHLEQYRVAGRARLSARRFETITSSAEERVREALKPYGYYNPDVTAALIPAGAERWRLEIRIEPGPPLVVSAADIELEGPGASHGALRAWRRDWPLSAGSVLNQQTWQEQKKAALDLARAVGYLEAHFSEHIIAVDRAANSARLTLTLVTGPQAEFGEVHFEQDVVRPYVLEKIPRFSPGSPYNAELLQELRLDLWRTGYFTDIEIREERHLDRDPPVVDLRARLLAETRNTYQGTIGFGTDTGIRLQGLWARHPLSSRGDRLDIGAGYREIDDEFSVRAEYRIPRRTAKRQFWIATAALRSENQDLEFKRTAADTDFVKLASGQVEDLQARFGRLQLRDSKRGFQQILETLYVQYLRESFEYLPREDAPPEILVAANDPRFTGLFNDTVTTVALGIEWDWPIISGSGFATEGHRERAWLFTANDAWGSELEFSQIYASTRRSYLFGERWKLLLRAEVGYSDAEVDEVDLDLGGEPLSLSVSRLPDAYRFKAGGSNSVRGYGFEELSNNDIGSNHVLAASAELEMRIASNWSLAAFADIGNAFNDWDRRELRKGIGIGVRWYMIAGAVRVDVARALDIDGKPWRLHFTMGSPLL